MSRRSLQKYLKLRECLDAAYVDKNYPLAGEIREEMAVLWSDLGMDEQSSVDTCPGTPIPIHKFSNPFSDPT